MRKLSWLLFAVSLLLVSCSEQVNHKGKTPLVEVDGNFLYKEDVAAILPVGVSSEDSAAFVDRFIQNWTEDVLFYETAEHNIPDNQLLEERVAQYRRALILHSFQQELVGQKLSLQFTDEEVRSYLEENKSLFLIEYPLIKGLFIKVPLSAPKIAQLRKWYKSAQQSAIESLEKYSLQHAVKYEYFYDKWLPMSDVLNLLPRGSESTEAYLSKKETVELKDTAYYYFLHITDYLPSGSEAPFEYAEPRVREVLSNTHKADFLRKVRSDLYEEAKMNNRIKIHKIDTEE